MYTHLGMRGLHYRDSLDVDPILNRNRKVHACATTDVSQHGYRGYRTACGQVLHIPVDGADSAWSDRVWPHTPGTRPSCKRCRTIAASD